MRFTPITVFHCCSVMSMSGRILLQAGIRHRNVQRAELLDGGRIHGVDLVLLGDVGLEHDGLAAEALDLVGDLLGGLGMGDVIDRHIGAGLGEAEGDGLADARIGARHERGLAGQDCW